MKTVCEPIDIAVIKCNDRRECSTVKQVLGVIINDADIDCRAGLRTSIDLERIYV